MNLREMQEAMRTALHEQQAFVGHHGRFDVYAGMYWSRLIEGLASDFPAVVALAGRELFDRLAVTHLKRRPSSAPSMAWLGRGFDETLRGLGLEREAAVASLEWARNEAFWSPDARAMTPAELGALGDALGDARLELHPSLRRLTLPVGVRAFVEAHEGAIDAAAMEAVVVWRSGEDVLHDALTPAEDEALARAQRGEPVGVCCEAFVSEPEPEAAAIGALVSWVSRGFVCGVRET